MSHGPQISVVIPAHNDAEPLRACLESLCRGASGVDAEAIEILVVDDASSDHPGRVLAAYSGQDCEHGISVRLIRLPRKSGAGAARNVGVAQARGKVILFTDADCVPMAGWARRFGEALIARNRADPNLVALCGKIDSPAGWSAKSHAYAGYAYVQGGPERATDCFNTANAAILRRVFVELGGFEESFAAHEDHDFGLRLAASEYETRFLPGIEVFHEHGIETFGAMMAKHARWGQTAGLRIEERHPERLGKLLPWLRRGWSHLLLVPAIALLSSARIIRHLLPVDPWVLIYAPGILLAKLAFRWNAFRFRHSPLT